MTSPDLFTWLRGLAKPFLRVRYSSGEETRAFSVESTNALKRLWPLALGALRASKRAMDADDALSAHETATIAALENEIAFAKEALDAFFAAAEKEWGGRA